MRFALTFVPAIGVWEMTSPAGTSSLAISSTDTLRSSFLSVVCATSTGLPTTLGTVTFRLLQKLPKEKKAHAKQQTKRSAMLIQMYFCGMLPM